MCILFLAIDQHPDYPVIICANRDEFYARPTQEAEFWREQPDILAGKDLQAGGSWFGINSSGCFAAITNIRTGIQQFETKRSRGELVTMVLLADSPIDDHWLKENSDEFNPFNLTYGHLNQLRCYNSIQKRQTHLTDGFHSISNGALDDIWPKMAKGARSLERLVAVNKMIDGDELFNILKDKTQAADVELPHTGIPLEWERKLSSIFINSSEYGTRSSSIIIQNKLGAVKFIERCYDDQGNKRGQRDFQLKVSRQ